MESVSDHGKQEKNSDGGVRAGLAETTSAKRGVTQEALAFEAGTGRSQISVLERIEKGPSLGAIPPDQDHCLIDQRCYTPAN